MKETAFDNLFKYDIQNYTLMDLDFFGISIRPNFFYHKTYKTILGLVLSFGFVILVIWEFSLKIIDLTGENYSFIETSQSLIYKKYIMPSFNISICASKTSLKMDFYYFGYFQISKNYFPYYQEEIEMADLYNATYTCYSYYLNNSEFFNTGNPYDTTWGKMSIGESYIGEEEEPNNLNFFIVISELFPENEKFYKRKLISKTQIYEIENVNSNNFEMTIIFDSYNLKEKTRFFGFEVNSKEKNYTIVNNVEIQKIKRNEYEMNSKIKIQYSGINITKMLIYFKLEHILGELGGFCFLFHSIFQTLVEIFSQNKVKKGIITQIEKNHEIRQTLGKLRTEDKFELRKKTLIFTEKNIDNAKKELNETNKKLSFSIKNTDNSHSLILPKHKSLLTSINYKLPKKNNYIKEITSSVINSKKIYENEYYQMTKYIDYSFFYQTLKELKIIEMLCLNEHNAQYFYNFRNEIFDIYELDQLLERASILNIESKEGNKIFNDNEMKCKIFQKSFFNETQ